MLSNSDLKDKQQVLNFVIPAPALFKRSNNGIMLSMVAALLSIGKIMLMLSLMAALFSIGKIMLVSCRCLRCLVLGR